MEGEREAPHFQLLAHCSLYHFQVQSFRAVRVSHSRQPLGGGRIVKDRLGVSIRNLPEPIGPTLHVILLCESQLKPTARSQRTFVPTC